MVCDLWLVDFDPLWCFGVSRFVACDCNNYYDWCQRKTQLWKQVLNFRVRMFVKSAVSNNITTAAHLKHQKNKENHAINYFTVVCLVNIWDWSWPYRYLYFHQCCIFSFLDNGFCVWWCSRTNQAGKRINFLYIHNSYFHINSM